MSDTIASLAPRLSTGELKSERLTEDALATIARLQPQLNAFITILADDALALGRAVDKEIAAGRYLGPLHGMPLSLKDLDTTAGVRTTFSSHAFATNVPDFDLAHVGKLELTSHGRPPQ